MSDPVLDAEQAKWDDFSDFRRILVSKAVLLNLYLLICALFIYFFFFAKYKILLSPFQKFW